MHHSQFRISFELESSLSPDTRSPIRYNGFQMTIGVTSGMQERPHLYTSDRGDGWSPYQSHLLKTLKRWSPHHLMSLEKSNLALPTWFIRISSGIHMMHRLLLYRCSEQTRATIRELQLTFKSFMRQDAKDVHHQNHRRLLHFLNMTRCCSRSLKNEI